ncbi:MAG: hypothetical protein HY978_04895 [Candidatus Liptonbacteria bacterium]|nr:hypothetical protein [Candidatus Liptonbacteria bacterium]
MNTKTLLKMCAYRNIPLGYSEAYELGEFVLRGCAGGDPLAQIQSTAILCALHNRATYAWRSNGQDGLPRSAAEQIAGLCQAIFDGDIAPSQFGFLRPDSPVGDCIGMGGDLLLTPNVSTLASLLAAAGGVPMCKHGSPANADAGRHGSSDFIADLGINGYAPREAVETCLRNCGFGYTEALDTRYKHIHVQTHGFAQLPHMNDLLGPLTNPVSPESLDFKIVGCNHLVPPRVVAEAMGILFPGLRCGLAIRGGGDVPEEGIDEVSISATGTEVAEVRDGQVREYVLRPADFGLVPVPAEFFSPPPGVTKGELSRRILWGELPDHPAEQLVLANAAVIFKVAGRAATWQEGYRLATEIQARRGGLELAQKVASQVPL